MSLLVSLYMWAVWLATGIFTFPLIMLLAMAVGRERAYPIVRVWIKAWTRLSGVRITVKGLEHLDPTRPFIGMGNHVNWLDPFFLAAVLPRPFVGLEKKENFKIPFYGWLMTAWGNPGIDRKDLAQAKRDLAAAAELMRRHNLVLLTMPEGTRMRDGRMQPFKKGCFHMALDTGIPIVPWSMNGAWEIQKRGQFWTQMGTVDFTFHPPIDPAAYGPERLEDLIADTRRAILSAYTGMRRPEDEIETPKTPVLDMAVNS